VLFANFVLFKHIRVIKIISYQNSENLSRSSYKEQERKSRWSTREKNRDFVPVLRKWLRSPWMAVDAVLTLAKLPLTLTAVHSVGSA